MVELVPGAALRGGAGLWWPGFCALTPLVEPVSLSFAALGERMVRDLRPGAAFEPTYIYRLLTVLKSSLSGKVREPRRGCCQGGQGPPAQGWLMAFCVSATCCGECWVRAGVSVPRLLIAQSGACGRPLTTVLSGLSGQ